MIDGVSALNAAKSAWSSSGVTGSASTGATSPTGSDFGSVMKQFLSDSVGTVESGEATAIQGLQGAAPAYKVVEAVMGAQRTLQAALAIRDKAVSAFDEISHMSI